MESICGLRLCLLGALFLTEAVVDAMTEYLIDSYFVRLSILVTAMRKKIGGKKKKKGRERKKRKRIIAKYRGKLNRTQ